MKSDLGRRLAELEAWVQDADEVFGARWINASPYGSTRSQDGLVDVYIGKPLWRGPQVRLTVEEFWQRYPQALLIEFEFDDEYHRLMAHNQWVVENGDVDQMQAWHEEFKGIDLWCQYVTCRQTCGVPGSAGSTVQVFCGCPGNHRRSYA